MFVAHSQFIIQSDVVPVGHGDWFSQLWGFRRASFVFIGVFKEKNHTFSKSKKTKPADEKNKKSKTSTD